MTSKKKPVVVEKWACGWTIDYRDYSQRPFVKKILVQERDKTYRIIDDKDARMVGFSEAKKSSGRLHETRSAACAAMLNHAQKEVSYAKSRLSRETERLCILEVYISDIKRE